jgi:hypothetical protein
MTNKVHFFYAHGTAYLLNILEVGFAVDLGLNQPASNSALVGGRNGQTARWSGGPQNDPFPSLLDPNVWDVTKLLYPALQFPMGDSIDYGVNLLINSINNLPAGKKFCLGGFSQGAAVTSGAYLAGLKPGTSGALEGRRNDFLGAVNFGNPRRAVNHRGAVGGTWSGSWNVNASTTGGHGSFPATGPYARLSNCESKWVEFAHTNDIFASVDESANALGANWVTGNGIFLTLGKGGLLNYLFGGGGLSSVISAANSAINLAGVKVSMPDAAGLIISWLGGNGHTAYPFLPPIGTTGRTA